MFYQIKGIIVTLRITKHALAIAASGVIAVSAAPAQAASICDDIGPSNLVKNCGFELSPPTNFAPADWTVTQAASNSYLQTAGNSNSGRVALSFGAAGPLDDTISQTLATTPGAQYTFTFYVVGDPGTSGNHFGAAWDGGELFSVVNDTSAAYVQETFTVLAAGSDTISFYGFDQTLYMYLDDVSVVAAAPEPASMLILMSGLAGVALTRRRRG